MCENGWRASLTSFWQLRFEFWQLAFNDVPDDFPIESKVVVDDSVLEAGNLCPRNVGVRLLECIGQLAHRFADDFQIASDRDFAQVIR